MMNSKRRLEGSDSEGEETEQVAASSSQLNGGSGSKRARLAQNGNGRNGSAAGPTRLHPEDSDSNEDVDELATPAPQAGPLRRETAKTGRDVGDVSMQEDGSDIEAEEEEDDDDEDGDEDDVQERALSTRNKEKGRVAEAGVVDYVVLKNFMCHQYMEVKLSPQINFLTGHNGSGKSVILTAITYAFGAKASASMRGSSQGSFIRIGASSCEVTLALRNKGDEAYKSGIYGKTIFITRRTSADGGGGYKIANWEKKTIFTTRSELSAICDHFQIQVDNPVNILHQDMAKLFLHSSKPTDKYRFFLKGTQLEQLMEEYQQILDQTQAVRTIARSKKDKLDELKDERKKAHDTWKEMERFETVEANILTQKNELAWTHVVEIEQQTQAAVTKQLEEQEKLSKIAAKLQAAEREYEEANKKLMDAQAAQEGDDAVDNLTKELDEVVVKIKGITAQMADARSEQREMQENITALRAQVEQRDKELLEEQSKVEGSLREKIIRSREKLAQVNQQREELTNKVQESRQQATEVGRLFEEERSKLDGVKRDQDVARKAFEQADAAIRNLQASQENTLNRFGNFAANIVMAIERERGWRQKPIGPIGNFIKLKDQRWAKVCEAVCGDRLNSFLVSSQEDRDRLNSLLRNFRGARHNVVLYQWDDTFENGLQNNLPDRQYTTMLDVLSFDDPYVRQAFIATASPEASILVADRRIGDDAMRRNLPAQSKIAHCYTLDLYALGGIQGGSRMIALQQYKGPPRLSKDIEADKQRAIVARSEAEEMLRRAKEERARLDRLLSNYTQHKKQAESDAHTASSQLRRLENDRARLTEEAQDFQPADVQAIEEAKQAALDEIENIRAQGHASATHVKELEISCKPYVQRKEELRNIIRQNEQIKRSRQDAMEELVTDRVTKEHNATAWKEKKEQHAARAQEKEDAVTAWGERLQEAMDRAGEMCPRANIQLKGKSAKKLEANIASLEKALREREQRLGGSREEIYKRYVKANAVYEENHKIVKDLRDCAETMLEAYELRVNRWTVFRTHIATRARIQFIRHLAQRGYTGDLRFNHDNHKLELRVQPNDDPTNKKSQRIKDSSTLSGGEKSFSTICLLLALWSAAGCPIRGLDEYDVFMDPVNRKVATNMLIEAGHAANNTQMILISPQQMTAYMNTPGVKVIRVADPERGQGTLATDATG